MKAILSALCAMMLTAPAAFAQPVTTESFKTELKAIIDDAAAGFPKSKGSRRSTSDYGTDYNSNLSLAGAPNSGHLYHYHSKWSRTEAFSFTRSFADSTAAGKFAAANAEDIMDELAKAKHWKKLTLKEDKEYRDKRKVKEYHNIFKSGPKMASITTNLPEGSGISVEVFSLYYPKDALTSNQLGCMVFWFSGSNFRYVVPVYGSALGDKEKVAADAYAKSGLVESSYSYEWMPGSGSGDVGARYGSGYSIKELSGYTVN